VIEGDDGRGGRNVFSQVLLSPSDLGAIHVAIVPRSSLVHRVESDEMNPAMVNEQ
jgi:hypothetical protein